ncbi:hypothetical protein AGABI2DRAFT_65472 [Agaricus bisporus var. bisporus H97]|uniref:hypothetical protein n=1 Tax=Agaricus bisporus var. bisporus (strain H97 / ATCC MYA-4626 / FGSC 10389) TaxID=936046 RepID=UPI00029F551F|nr:hypothetical protein AGABI2DRAFT_65472 [Agaricus bisporus var. bisporus H97]EKV49034.1 hypothetical protein AGABI2DRAFT_65472 [Agaricus bisporus var. bisporus H97]
MAGNLTRQRALALYKELRQLGRDYPDPAYDFNGRVRRLFEKNRNLTDRDEIEKALRMGEYIKKGVSTPLYSVSRVLNRIRKKPWHSILFENIDISRGCIQTLCRIPDKIQLTPSGAHPLPFEPG